MNIPAQVKRLEHIGIAVRSIEQARVLYETMFGLEAEEIEELEHMKLRVLRLSVPNDLSVELIEPQSGEEVISSFIEKRGEGLHHICFEVENVSSATRAFLESGYEPVWDEARKGSHEKTVNFLRPSGTGGVLIELSGEK